MNTVKQGNIGVSIAIAEFTIRGYPISIPLNDTQPYDLVVDVDGVLKKVQVKTTRSKQHQSFVVQIKSVRPNRTKNTIRHFDGAVVDFLFVSCENGDRYLIPANEIDQKTMLYLGPKYDKYKLERNGVWL